MQPFQTAFMVYRGQTLYNCLGNNIAMVQDCCHDKDYHNDTMETQPFKMDNSDDQSHIVDWKKHMKQLIREAVQEALVNIDKYYCRG